jgi:hypothetical protein
MQLQAKMGFKVNMKSKKIRPFNYDKIAYFTRSKPDPTLDGGSRRSYQICSNFENLQVFYIYQNESSLLNQNKSNKQPKYKRIYKGIFNNNSLFKLIRKYIKQIEVLIVLGREYFFWEKAFRYSVYSLRKASKNMLNRIVDTYDLILIDDPIFLLPVLKYYNKKAIPVIAMSQNIETFVRQQVNPKKQIRLVGIELKCFQNCAKVITISREEAFFLKNFGINAYFYPYYPSDSEINRLLTIRKKRGRLKHEGVFLLGTSGNVATRFGMIKIINQWRTLSIKETLYVAGYRTENLRGCTKSFENIKILGSLSREELDLRLISSKAVLVYQESAGGALTRIVESLIANVPVVGNTHALRSYYNIEGTYEINDLAKIDVILSNINKNIPIPENLNCRLIL